MLRRVTALAALGGVSHDSAEARSIHDLLGIPFTEVDQRRRRRSSGCSAMVGLSWNFDPPAASRHEVEPEPLHFIANH
jgi:hypothetical protein